MSDELSGVAPEGGEEAIPGPEPTTSQWEAWEKAGIDPSQMNPYEVRQYVDWVGELTSNDTHEQALENALRQWGHLGEEESLQDLLSLRDQMRQQQEDPFGRLVGGEDEGGEYEGFEEPGYQEQNLIDPYELREVWQRDMQQQLAQERQAMQEQIQTERLVQDLQGQLEHVASDQGLDEDEKAFLWEAATQKLINRQVDVSDVPNLMDQTWKQIDALYQKRVARVAKASDGQPRTSVPPAGVPGDGPGGRGLSQALAKTAEALGIQPE